MIKKIGILSWYMKFSHVQNSFWLLQMVQLLYLALGDLFGTSPKSWVRFGPLKSDIILLFIRSTPHLPINKTLSKGWKVKEIDILEWGFEPLTSCCHDSYPLLGSDISQTRTSADRSPEANKFGFVGWNTTDQHVRVCPESVLISLPSFTCIICMLWSPVEAAAYFLSAENEIAYVDRVAGGSWAQKAVWFWTSLSFYRSKILFYPT